MIRFHQTFGAHTGRVCEFHSEVIRFGRMPDSDVVFDANADLDASGRHAEVRFEGRWVLMDVGSRNGTYVNGRRVERTPLQTGDVIEFGLGGPRLKVEIAASVGRPGQITAAATPAAGPSLAEDLISAAGVGAKRPMSDDQAPLTPYAGAHRSDLGANPPFSPGGSAPSYSPPTPALGGAPPSYQAPAVQAPQPKFGAPAEPGASKPPGGGAGGSEKRFGHKTVAMMIQSALSQAADAQGQGNPRSTAFMRAVATEAAHHASWPTRVALVILSVLFALAMVAIVVLAYFAFFAPRPVTQNGADPLPEQESDSAGTTSQEIVERYRGAVYLLVATNSEGVRRALCTGFAVRPRLLGTNAHCVLRLEAAQGEREALSAVPNVQDGAAPIPIRRMWRHPDYDRADSHPGPDVGLLRVDSDLPLQVDLATIEQLRSVDQGSAIYVLGYPGELANTTAPAPALSPGTVALLTSFEGVEADLRAAQVVYHTAATSSGTSGSPVFNADGLVVAINTGGIRSPPSEALEASDPPAPESGYRYAVRSDLLTSLLDGLAQQEAAAAGGGDSQESARR